MNPNDTSIRVTVEQRSGRVQYEFPLWWSIAAVGIATALSVLGVVAVQAGWLR